MLSSKFIVVSFLYLFYASSFVAAVPRGGDQFCESVRTVTVVQTVTNNQPPPSSPPNKASPPPSGVTQQPGNVNLGNGNGNNKNGSTKQSSANNNNTKNGNTKSSSTSVAPPTATPPGKTNVVSSDNGDPNNGDPNNGDPNNGDPNNGDPNNGGNGGPDSSLTLDPSVIQNINGKAQGAGQIDSVVSPNNFINYCVGKTIPNGHQVKTGSCNPTPMGDIPSVDNMPTAKFQSPTNFDTIPANTQFTINLKVNNLNTGTFVDAANAYFAAPQQLVNGLIKGHSHITVQQMQSLDSTQPLDPTVFAFFKGLNDAANNGVLSATVTNGLPPGVYRISSINAAANHQEVVGPVAQRGSFNDVVYVTVTDGGQNANSVSSSSIPPADPTSSSVLPTSVSSDVLSSSISSPTVSSTSPTVSPSNGGDEKGGKDPKSSPTDSLPASTSSSSPEVSSTASLPVPTGADGKNDGKQNNDVSSSEIPVPSSTDGKGDPTSTPLPETPTPTSGDGKTDTKDPNGNNGPNSKRMHRRLSSA